MDILSELLDEKRINHQIRKDGTRTICILNDYDYDFLQKLYELGYEYEEKFQEEATNKVRKWLEIIVKED